MSRNLHSFCASKLHTCPQSSKLHTCPQSCTVGHAFPGKAVPHLASWNGMVERTAPGTLACCRTAKREERKEGDRSSGARAARASNSMVSAARKRAHLFPFLLYHLLSRSEEHTSELQSRQYLV